MPYQEAQFGKILKPATRAGFKIWSTWLYIFRTIYALI